MAEENLNEISMSFDDGNWYAVTLGKFLELLVDAGHDPAVCFRVVSDYCHDDKSGTFIRKLEVIMVPDGHVVDAIKDCYGIHKTLKALVEAGVIK